MQLVGVIDDVGSGGSGYYIPYYVIVEPPLHHAGGVS